MAGLDLKQYKNTIQPNTNVLEEKAHIFSFLNKDIKILPTRLSDKQKEALYLEMGIMISAGVDIRAALELVEQEQKKEKNQKIIHSIKEAVIDGAALSQAFSESGYFTSYEFYSIQIGEETGKLPDVLNQLAQFYTNKLKQQRQLINALSYPLVILFTSVSAVSFMLYFIVPMFSDVFKRFGGELPYITQLIINMSAFLSSNILSICLSIGVIISSLLLVRKKDWFQFYSAQLVMKIPVIGSVFAGLYLARFCTSMNLLIGSRVPLLRAIQLVKQMITFYPISSSLGKVEQDILQGKSLHESLSDFSIYDSRMIALLKVGEEVNKLDTFFGKLASNYTDEVEHRTTLLSTFLEPLMIIFLGIVVGFILIAMYLPMFQLSTSIGS